MPPTQFAPFRVFKVRTATDSKREWVTPAGVTPAALRSSRYRRLFHGVYVDARAPITPVLLAQAALLRDPQAVASHHTAARIWGGVVPDDGLTHIACLGPRPQVHGIKAHARRTGRRFTTHRGVRVTTPAWSFLDLTDALGLVDLVVLGDSLVTAGNVTPQQLVEAAAAFPGRSRRLARRAAALVRAEVDSPMESRLRLLLVLAGLPEPVVNYKVCRPDGSVRYRFDLSYPEARLVIEYDGRQHAESDTQWDTDVSRREWLDARKWRLVIVRAKDVYRTPATTLSRVISAMRDQGMCVPRLSDEWRQHFASLPEDTAEPACPRSPLSGIRHGRS